MTLTVMEAPYPSVDCTFWWQSRVDTECLIRILDAVSKGHVVAVVEQHCILPHVHRYPDQCARLINLDCSSDLGGLEDICVDGYPGGDFRRLEFSPESWVDYVDVRNKKTFVWGHPRVKCPTDDYCCVDYDNLGRDIPFPLIPQRTGSPWQQPYNYRTQLPITASTLGAYALLALPSRRAGPMLTRQHRSSASSAHTKCRLWIACVRTLHCTYSQILARIWPEHFLRLIGTAPPPKHHGTNIGGLMKGRYLSIDPDVYFRRTVDIEFVNRVLQSPPTTLRPPSTTTFCRTASDMQASVYIWSTPMPILIWVEPSLSTIRRTPSRAGHSNCILALGVIVLVSTIHMNVPPAFPDAECGEKNQCDAFSSYKPFEAIDRLRWAKLQDYKVEGPHYGIDLRKVRAASIVLSTDVSGPDAFDSFVSLVGGHEIELFDLLRENLTVDKLKRGKVDYRKRQPRASYATFIAGEDLAKEVVGKRLSLLPWESRHY